MGSRSLTVEKGVTNTERGKPRSNPFIKFLQGRAERQGSENASYKVTLFRGAWGIKRDKPEVTLPWPGLTHQGSSLSLGCSAPRGAVSQVSPQGSQSAEPLPGAGGAVGALTPHLAASCLSRNPLAFSQVFWDPFSCWCPGEQTPGIAG